MTWSILSTLDKLANVFSRLQYKQMSWWCNPLELLSPLAAKTHIIWCKYESHIFTGAIRSDFLSEFYGAFSSVVFSYRPRLCQRLHPNTRLLFLSCRSYASLRCWEMCLVCTLTTHKHRYASYYTCRKATTLGCIPTSPLKHTLTQMSNSPSLLYNLGTMFIWCYWVNTNGYL